MGRDYQSYQGVYGDVDATIVNWPDQSDEDRRKRWRFEAACHAMQGIIIAGGRLMPDHFTLPQNDVLTKHAVAYADGILAELEKTEQIANIAAFGIQTLTVPETEVTP